MEEVQARQRKEQRDLQSRITQKKKQASKKTRKVVNDECDRLEGDLRQRHEAEIAGITGEAVDEADLNEQLEDMFTQIKAIVNSGPQQNESEEANATALPQREVNEQTQGKKPNRQKARLARRAAEKEEQARQAAEEAKNLPDLKQQERERMLEYMKERGQQEKEIRADGHCLYSAVADQLDQLQIPLGAAPDDKPAIAYKVVRAAAANYIEKHQDDFVPFLEEPLPEYLHKVRDTGEWGGQLELIALAKTYGTDINVLQDFGMVEKIESGSGEGDKAMWLGYYKHGFGLGEHYNSLRKVP